VILSAAERELEVRNDNAKIQNANVRTKCLFIFLPGFDDLAKIICFRIAVEPTLWATALNISRARESSRVYD